MNIYLRNTLLGMGALIGVGSGCDCATNNTKADCPSGQTSPITINLTRDLAASSASGLIYSGSTNTGLPDTCVNRLQSFSINTTYRVLFLDATQQGCTDPKLVLGPALTPGAKVMSTGPDQMQLFGDPLPKLPVNFRACVEAGGNPPEVIPVYLQLLTD